MFELVLKTIDFCKKKTMSGLTSPPVIFEINILQEQALWHVKVSKMLLLITTISVCQGRTQRIMVVWPPPTQQHYIFSRKISANYK